MSTLLEQYQAERDGLVSVIDSTLSAVEGRDLSDSEQRTVTDTRTRIEALDRQIELVNSAIQTRNAGIDLSQSLRSERRERAGSPEVRSIGEQFAKSPVFAEYRGHGTSSRFNAEMRALPTGLADVSDLSRPGLRVNATPPTVTPLLDALNSIQVSSNGFEVVVWTKDAGGAAKVAEKSAKPSVEFGPTVTPITLDTIAGYTQMTRQLIEDEPAIRDAINGMLMRDVMLKLEAEAATAIAGATLATATDTVTLLGAIRKGVGVVQAKGYQPGAVLLNPADWAELDIDVFSGTSAGGSPIQRSFWGLVPIAAASQPAGTATVADLGAAVQHYRRSGVSLYITDSHGDTFLSNVFTVLAEARAKTVVVRPDAAVECSKA
jgi:HK97 family phage major capsid protein